MEPVEKGLEAAVAGGHDLMTYESDVTQLVLATTQAVLPIGYQIEN